MEQPYYTRTNNLSIFACVFPQIKFLPDNTYMNKREIKDVLAELMGDMNQNALEEVGVSQPNINRILKGTHQTLQLNTAIKIAEFFKISVDQLIGNEPLDTDEDWFRIKKAWRKLDCNNKRLAITMIEAMVGQNPTNNAVDHGRAKPIELKTGRLGGNEGHPRENTERRVQQKTIDQERRQTPWKY